MTDERLRDPSETTADSVLLSMFSSALGREITAFSLLTANEELTAGVAVQGRLDAAAQAMEKIGKGEEADLGALADTEAQAALLLIAKERDAGSI